MKQLLFFIFLFSGLIVSIMAQPSPAYGDSGCTPIYGGGVDCPPTDRITLDKTVKNPVNNVFVDNLGVNDRKFLSGEIVVFRLRVENTTNTALSDVVVTDRLPDYVTFVSGTGSYNSATKALTITIGTLGAKEVRNFDINVRVVNVNQLPAERAVICTVNSATAKVDDETDSDTAQVCIEKQVLGAPELPIAGPEHTILLTAGLGALFIIGRKLSKVNINN